MTDKKDDATLNKEDQKLSNPVTETKQADPSTAQEVRDYKTVEDPARDKLDLRNGKFDEKDTDAGDKTKTADKAVEDARILVDRIEQSAAKNEEKFNDYGYSKDDSFAEKVTKIGKSIKGSFLGADLKEARKDLEGIAKDLNVDLGDVAKSVGIEDISKEIHLNKLTEVYGKLYDIAKARLADAETKQQKAQANYIKSVEEAAKRKAESKPAPKAQGVAESTRNQLTEVTTKEQEAQAKYDKDQKDYKTWEAKDRAGAEKDETKDPLEKAEELEEELEQKKYQTPADIKRFSNDLNKFVIQAYLNGDFGKKSSPNAIATMGFFILDKIGAALVNASEVARGMSPSAKSQWSNVLDKQMELLGKRITSEWLLNLPREKLEALVRSGDIQPVTGDDIYGATDPNAVIRAAQRDALGNSKLSQEQKGVAQSNFNALLARKSELQTLITQLKSDQGWEVYTQAMNAIVGTAKGLNTLGVTDASNSSSQKGLSDTLSANVSTGKVTAAFVSGGISNNSTWNNSSAESLSKSNSLSQDALAYSKFKSGEDYAKATREAKKEANEQLIKRLEGQIEIIDKCIDSWGKDLGL